MSIEELTRLNMERRKAHKGSLRKIQSFPKGNIDEYDLHQLLVNSFYGTLNNEGT